jgi:hypothetical protein
MGWGLISRARIWVPAFIKQGGVISVGGGGLLGRGGGCWGDILEFIVLSRQQYPAPGLSITSPPRPPSPFFPLALLPPSPDPTPPQLETISEKREFVRPLAIKKCLLLAPHPHIHPSSHPSIHSAPYTKIFLLTCPLPCQQKISHILPPSPPLKF